MSSVTGSEYYSFSEAARGVIPKLEERFLQPDALQCGPKKTLACLITDVLLMVAGIFILLAAYQVLPKGINAISRWTTWGAGKVCGFAILAFGVLQALTVTCAWSDFKGRQKLKRDVHQTISHKLYRNELFVIMDEDQTFSICSSQGPTVHQKSREEVQAYLQRDSVLAAKTLLTLEALSRR